MLQEVVVEAAKNQVVDPQEHFPLEPEEAHVGEVAVAEEHGVEEARALVGHQVLMFRWLEEVAACLSLVVLF